MDKDKVCKAISRVKLEDEEEHERNIEYMAQDDDDYKSLWKNKYVTDLKAVTDSSFTREIALQILSLSILTFFSAM